jgi:hypothetical protein
VTHVWGRQASIAVLVPLPQCRCRSSPCSRASIPLWHMLFRFFTPALKVAPVHARQLSNLQSDQWIANHIYHCGPGHLLHVTTVKPRKPEATPVVCNLRYLISAHVGRVFLAVTSELVYERSTYCKLSVIAICLVLCHWLANSIVLYESFTAAQDRPEYGTRCASETTCSRGSVVQQG